MLSALLTKLVNSDERVIVLEGAEIREFYEIFYLPVKHYLPDPLPEKLWGVVDVDSLSRDWYTVEPPTLLAPDVRHTVTRFPNYSCQKVKIAT